MELLSNPESNRVCACSCILGIYTYPHGRATLWYVGGYGTNRAPGWASVAQLPDAAREDWDMIAAEGGWLQMGTISFHMYWILCLWIERNRLDNNYIPQPQLLLLIVVQEISPPCLGACQTFSWHMLNRCRQPDCLSSNRLKVIVVHHVTMKLHVWGAIIMSKSRNSRRNV